MHYFNESPAKVTPSLQFTRIDWTWGGSKNSSEKWIKICIFSHDLSKSQYLFYACHDQFKMHIFVDKMNNIIATVIRSLQRCVLHLCSACKCEFQNCHSLYAYLQCTFIYIRWITCYNDNDKCFAWWFSHFIEYLVFVDSAPHFLATHPRRCTTKFGCIFFFVVFNYCLYLHVLWVIDYVWHIVVITNTFYRLVKWRKRGKYQSLDEMQTKQQNCNFEMDKCWCCQ